jgi:glycosyltransferase involved in cell wall biosynthesis
MKLRIAAFHAFLNVEAGASGAFISMMKYLKREGIEVEVFSLSISDEIKRTLEGLGIPYSSPKSTFEKFLFLRKISREIPREKYDLCFFSHYAYSPILIKMMKGIPKLYYLYEPPRIFYEPPQKGIGLKRFDLITREIDKIGTRSADLILCSSDYIREYIYKVYGKFAIVNRLGVDLEKYDYKKLGIDVSYEKRENMIVSIGVIHPQKAHDFVIRSLIYIPKAKRPKLLIITSGIIHDYLYLKQIYELAKKLDIYVEVKERFIPHYDFCLALSKSKLMAIPYIMEPSVEPVAYAFKTPIVAVREAGAREAIIDGVTGFLVQRNEKEFAKAIEFLLDNPDIAAKMGEEGYQLLQREYSMEKCAQNLIKNIKFLLNKMNE